MAIQIFINVRPYQTRVACVEKTNLTNLFYHRKKNPSLVGSIFKGRVSKITKSLNFAFIDIGLERSGFLYGKDLSGPVKDVGKLLKIGQEILVQIKADPLRNKGVRLSMEISLAGLFLVYLPEQKTKNPVSRQILSKEERERLTKIVSDFKESGALIVRTFAQNHTNEEILKDLNNLKETWKQLQDKFKNQTLVGQIQKGEDPLLGFLRDALSLEVDRFVVDDKETFKKIVRWIQTFNPDMVKKVEHYKGIKSLFENFDLQSQVQKTTYKKLMLKNGGFLIFEELEAFCVIDVNSGRFSGSKSLSKSLLDLNLEAAKIIAEQVRLRHLGGIILIDFIDMKEAENGRKVVSCLERGFKGDKSHPKVFPMGELGMIQITRKRSKNSLYHFMTDLCPSCQGLGRKKTLPTIVNELFLKIENCNTSSGFLRLLKRNQKIRVSCHPKIKNYIETKESESLEFFNKNFSLYPLIEEDASLSLENFRIEKL